MDFEGSEKERGIKGQTQQVEVVRKSTINARLINFSIYSLFIFSNVAAFAEPRRETKKSSDKSILPLRLLPSGQQQQAAAATSRHTLDSRTHSLCHS